MLPAVRSVLRRPARTLLTVAGIAVATGNYILLVSLALGMKLQAQGLVDELGTDVAVMRVGSPFPMDSKMTGSDLEALRRVPGVAAVSEVVVSPTRLNPRNYFFIFGLDPQQRILRGLRITAGRGIQASAELLVGERAAEQLELQPGDLVEVARTRLQVVGLYHTARSFLDTGAIADIPTTQRIFDLGGRINLAFLDLANDADVTSVLDHIHRESPNLEASPSEFFASRLRNLDLVRIYARWLALLAVLVAHPDRRHDDEPRRRGAPARDGGAAKPGLETLAGRAPGGWRGVAPGFCRRLPGAAHRHRRAEAAAGRRPVRPRAARNPPRSDGRGNRHRRRDRGPVQPRPGAAGDENPASRGVASPVRMHNPTPGPPPGASRGPSPPPRSGR